jgi:hypothetical protein
MLSWLRGRHKMMEQVEAEAEGLIHELGSAAFVAARARENESSSVQTAQHWRRIASAIARMKEEQMQASSPARSVNEDNLPSAIESRPY